MRKQVFIRLFELICTLGWQLMQKIRTYVYFYESKEDKLGPNLNGCLD